MSAHWTGYGIIVWPNDPDEPRCKMIRLSPCDLPTIEKATSFAEVMWRSMGEGRDCAGIVVDRWDRGKIVEPRVFCIPTDFNDMIEGTYE